MFYKRSKALYEKVSNINQKSFSFVWVLMAVQLLFGYGIINLIFTNHKMFKTNSQLYKFGETPLQPQGNIVVDMISYFLATLLLLVISMGIYHYVKTGELSFSHLKQMLAKDWKKILVVSVVLSAIGFLLSLIPVIGAVLETIFSFSMLYVPYVMHLYEANSVFDILKHSYSETDGYKWDLFCIQMHYLWLPTLLLVIVILLFIVIAPFLYVGIYVVMHFIFSYFVTKVKFANAYYYEGYLEFQRMKEENRQKAV